MNNKGYTTRELLIVCGILIAISIFAIIKVSFEYSEAYDEELVQESQKASIENAAGVYVKLHSEEITSETIIYGQDLIKEGLLIDRDSTYISNAKIKIIPKEEGYEINVLDN